MSATEFLNRRQPDNDVSSPHSSEISQFLATEDKVAAAVIAKPVVVNADGEFYVCVVPASGRMDMEILSWLLGANRIHCASDNEMARLFPNCKTGDRPTLSEIFGLPTILDKRITANTNILFQASIDSQVIRIELAELEGTAAIQILDFCY